MKERSYKAELLSLLRESIDSMFALEEELAILEHTTQYRAIHKFKKKFVGCKANMRKLYDAVDKLRLEKKAELAKLADEANEESLL